MKKSAIGSSASPSAHTYIDTAFGSPNRRNNVASIDELEIPANITDCYTTMFRFGEDYKKLCAETGSVKGASKLSCYSDFLWFDIDAEELIKALVNARSLVINIEQLNTSLSDHLIFYFSGSKGFHIGIPATLFGWEPSVELPRIHKILAPLIAAEVDIDTAIYEHNRLWRIPNTKHGKSGLYKVPLTYDQLATWSIDQITRFAAKPTAAPALAIPMPTAIKPNERLQRMYEQARAKVKLPKKANLSVEPSIMHRDELKKPCIQLLLNGVEAGDRNEAAIRLCAAFKKSGYSLERTLASMSEWNLKNQPPLSDSELESVCQSTLEGPYDYGCNDPVLKAHCDSTCHLKDKGSKSDPKKRQYATSVTVRDGSLSEMIIDVSGSQFVTYDPNCVSSDGCVSISGVLPGDIYPHPAELIKRIGAVYFPSMSEPYGDTATLVRDIDRFVRKYLSVSEFYHKIIPYYVLFSWVYDRFSELPYLRALGDYGTGKSRFLKTVGAICYKPIFTMGAASVSSIFRLLDMFRGTLILDEADLSRSDESHQITKMLNTGYQKDFPLFRSEPTKNGSFVPVSFQVFGPKIIATRQEFKDQALESRCLTEQMDGKVRPGIPLNLTESFWEEALSLRNRLLTWRLHNYHKIQPPEELTDLKIHPRLAQILYPLCSVIDDESVLNDLKTFMLEQDGKLKEAKQDSTRGKVLMALLELRSEAENGRLTVKEITEKVNESNSNDRSNISNERVGRIINNTFGLPRERSGNKRLVVLDSSEAEDKLRYWRAQFGLEMDR